MTSNPLSLTTLARRVLSSALWIALACPFLSAAALAHVPIHPASFLPHPSPARVLVVLNTRSPDSVAIATYYIQKRHIPPANVCRIECPVTEECSMAEYDTQIKAPIKRFLASLKPGVDFILLTKGFPLRIKEGGFSPDSLLTSLDWSLLQSRTPNPYFAKDERFSHARFNLYLVTRLDGYTRADCLRMVDNSLAAKPTRGPFLLITDPNREHSAYQPANDGIRHARELLAKKGMECILDPKEGFVGGYKNLMGYFSWGSNDRRFDKKAYRSLGFAPGGIAETAVSTSARTFADPNAPGQSLIGDLIAQGVTGCKGYVSEPFVDSIALADILFDRYTSGYTLAESFYMASRFVYWKDIILGDPLCAPYAKTKGE